MASLSTVAASAQLVVVSDSHLSGRALDAERNWSAVVITSTAQDPTSWSMSATCPSTVRTTPRTWTTHGSSWVGFRRRRGRGSRQSRHWGQPIPEGDPAGVVTDENLASWTRAVGPLWWTLEIGGWQLVGVNAQLFGSRLPAEEEQWEWLEEVMATVATRPCPLVFVSHKPIDATDTELATAPGIRFVPSPARDRLRARLTDVPRNRLVLSGHVHQYRALELDGTAHVWAPTTWAALPDSWQATIGTKLCGVLQLALSRSGSADHRFVAPEGLRQLVVGEDTPLYYPH